MTVSFRDSLPPELVANTVALCGERGERWLKRLPELIRALERRWSITAGKHFPNIEYNYVAAAECEDGTSAVLKIGLPLENIEIYGEAKYLETLAGNGGRKAIERRSPGSGDPYRTRRAGQKSDGCFRRPRARGRCTCDRSASSNTAASASRSFGRDLA